MSLKIAIFKERRSLEERPNSRSSTPAAGDAMRSDHIMWQAIMRIQRGIAAALRARPGVFVAVTTGFFALELFLPPAVLSVARKPLDYFTFNPWLPELPGYLLAADIPLQRKLEFLPNLALVWFSADSPFGGVDWGFAVTVSDLLRFLLLSLLFGLYFALVLHCRDRMPATGWNPRLSRRGGALGALASVLGVSAGGCTVMGCGAPVIPVVGLAFVGLSSGTLALLAEVSRAATTFVFIAVTLGMACLGWLAGGSAIAGSGSGQPIRAPVETERCQGTGPVNRVS
jgi:hypothetical protein